MYIYPEKVKRRNAGGKMRTEHRTAGGKAQKSVKQCNPETERGRGTAKRVCFKKSLDTGTADKNNKYIHCKIYGILDEKA